MSKKTKKTAKPTSGFIFRTRIIITTLAVLIAGSGLTVYALSTSAFYELYQLEPLVSFL